MKSFAEKFHRCSDKARPNLGRCVYGLAASAAAVGFQLAINRLYLFSYKAPAAISPGHFLLSSLATIVVTSLAVGWLLNSFAPEAAGSGDSAGESLTL